uniref:Snurportin-1 n=1 Tax=Trichuris muris TaxID=70415 RepID=A0A5S6QD27_TRIMR
METEDDVLCSVFAGSMLDDKKTFSVYRPHPRFAQYKAHVTMETSQEKRRKLLLENQRSKRLELIAHLRSLYDVENNADDSEDFKMDDQAEDNVEVVKHDEELGDVDGDDNMSVATSRTRTFPFRDKLTMGEWLVDIPSDFSSQWLFMPCPEGKRCLIVVEQNWTRSYNRAGRRLGKFRSALPNRTMLDCVSCDSGDTIYVLDVLMWKGQALVDYDCEFRFFWMSGRLEDCNMDAKLGNRFGRKKTFVVLPKYKCSHAMLQDVMNKRLWPFEGRLDGLLFYHGSSLYESGETPLVGWLKPFMLKELLGVTVPDEYSMSDESLIEDFSRAAQRKVAASL